MSIKFSFWLCIKLCLLIITTHILLACATQQQPNSLLAKTHSHLNQATKKVLVINSNKSVERYHVAEANYLNALPKMNTQIINLEAENQPIDYLQDILNQEEFDVIYCIGAKALVSIDYIQPDVPVVYSAVLNWRKFQKHNNYYGIASELSPQVQLTWLKYFFRDINKIGVLYSEDNQYLIDDASIASNNLSLKLKAVKLTREQQLIPSAEALFGEVDALWLISDASTLSSVENINAIFSMAHKRKVSVISYNPIFMDVGATMSLVADLPTTARQAALLTTKLLENNLPKSSVQFPAGSRIILNTTKVHDYKTKLNPGALDSVDGLY